VIFQKYLRNHQYLATYNILNEVWYYRVHLWCPNIYIFIIRRCAPGDGLSMSILLAVNAYTSNSTPINSSSGKQLTCTPVDKWGLMRSGPPLHMTHCPPSDNRVPTDATMSERPIIVTVFKRNQWMVKHVWSFSVSPVWTAIPRGEVH
jgi:hypothetical protein